MPCFALKQGGISQKRQEFRQIDVTVYHLPSNRCYNYYRQNQSKSLQLKKNVLL